MVGQGRRKASRGECVKTMDVVDESIEIIVNTIARYFSCVAPKPLTTSRCLRLRPESPTQQQTLAKGHTSALPETGAGGSCSEPIRTRKRKMPDAHEILNEWAHGANAKKRRQHESGKK